ncbi:unnamed protein product [Triticum turgidum subsp. durum]|uniref:Spo11/DNA topoisomerase VI subunit A N-terminal domain-containing protein n=1 Tax=Triticum turgidum subsp. durum TaxID=4567 RepID=A0A9R0XI05_TRITD|nr:unnamed protein product [Triticum turgidum subsp. durum]
MAGSGKRRRATVLDDDERRGRRRLEEAALLLHKIKDVLLRVLLVVQQLLQENKHCSKRDIYYMYPSMFVEQAIVDRAINDICILFKCSRHNLNVVPVAKGLVMGWIRFVEGEKKVYCITNVNTAFPIPVSIEAIKDVVSVAHYILVVEKEAGIGGSLKEFSPDVTCTRKPQNGG